MQAVQANIIAAQAVQAMLIRAPVSLRQESCAGETRAGICDPAAVTAAALAQGSMAILHNGMLFSTYIHIQPVTHLKASVCCVLGFVCYQHGRMQCK